MATDAPVLSLLSGFHTFLDQLETRSKSRGHSDTASKLEVGALSSIILEDMLKEAGSSGLAEKVLSGVATEGLAVLATRQHVKAWDNELAAVCREAAWHLYGELWEFTMCAKPELEASERRQLLDQLLDPLNKPETTLPVRVALVQRFYQILLVDACCAAASKPDSDE
ncbi:MAG: hypothetical protein GY906_26430 [bacterium]|nr:hypothetical protein [bacterium]